MLILETVDTAFVALWAKMLLYIKVLYACTHYLNQTFLNFTNKLSNGPLNKPHWKTALYDYKKKKTNSNANSYSIQEADTSQSASEEIRMKGYERQRGRWRRRKAECCAPHMANLVNSATLKPEPPCCCKKMAPLMWPLLAPLGPPLPNLTHHVQINKPWWARGRKATHRASKLQHASENRGLTVTCMHKPTRIHTQHKYNK